MENNSTLKEIIESHNNLGLLLARIIPESKNNKACCESKTKLKYINKLINYCDTKIKDIKINLSQLETYYNHVEDNDSKLYSKRLYITCRKLICTYEKQMEIFSIEKKKILNEIKDIQAKNGIKLISEMIIPETYPPPFEVNYIKTN